MLVVAGVTWENFCTFSKNDDDYYDHIFIDRENKKYLLLIEECDFCLNFYDAYKNKVISPTYIERKTFDETVDNLNRSDFKRIKIDIWSW